MIEMIKELLSNHFTEILGAIITGLAGWLGAEAKKLYTKYINTKTKKEIADTVVQFVEQVYKDLHGEEKLNVALSAFSEMLAEAGISASDLEMRILLEAAVAKFNDAFSKGIALDPAKVN